MEGQGAAYQRRPPPDSRAEGSARWPPQLRFCRASPPLGARRDALAPNAYSGATIRPALRGAKVKFKGGGLVWLADEGQKALCSIHIYIVENKKVFS